MSGIDSDFFKELLSMFKLESEEHIQTIISGLKKMESIPPSDAQIEISETIHRAAHSLKGAARTVGLSDVEPICQSLESVFGIFKRQKVDVPPELFDMLHRVVKGLEKILGSMNEEGKVTADKSEIIRLIVDINSKAVTLPA